jgi:methyltransferase family protein
MKRHIEPEWLDTLPADDPRAVHSRRDLRRVNWWMGHPGTIARALRAAWPGEAPARVVDLGGGDGDLCSRIAQRLSPDWGDRTAVLVDRQNTVNGEATRRFSACGWRVEVVVADVFQWLLQMRRSEGTVFVANLFLHHFGSEQLADLIEAVAARGTLLVACEPRRGLWPLVGARLLGLIGCNDVTRHDAAASVRAGFAGRELSALWRTRPGWRLSEGRAGPFSHLFVARKERSRPWEI